MNEALHIDVETRSTCDLRKTGAHFYFEDKTTDLWCAAWAIDDEPTEIWIPPDPPPARVVEHIRAGKLIYAHNAPFERLVFKHLLGPRYGWPVPELTQWRCTMAMCLAQALPAALDDACAVTASPISKDAAGARVMKQMAKPRRPRKDEPTDRLYWWDEPEKRAILYAYCKTDVDAERRLHKRIAKLPAREQELWFLDQIINDRGVRVDTRLCQAALAIVDEARERMDREMRDVTSGDVASTTAVNQLKTWLLKEGLDVGDSLAKDVINEILVRSDLGPKARRALELRREGSKASVAKIDALLNGTQRDGRSRGLLQYHAASTGRWGGRRFQPQNIKRPEFKDQSAAVAAVATGDIHLVEMLYGDPLRAIGDTLRGMVFAAEGHRLIAADYSNIEGRVLAWLAGEAWKVDAFAAYDAGEGPDLYKLAYGRSFGIDAADVSKEQRQVGKVMELALGYGGGVGAFETMAAAYDVRIGEQYDYLIANTPARAIEQASSTWLSRGKSSGIEERTWISAEIVKILWRETHPNVRQLWRDMEDAAMSAVAYPGTLFRVRGMVEFDKKGSFLHMRLPNGKCLWYAFPKIERKLTAWTDDNGKAVYKDTLTYEGVDSTTRQWRRQSTYGGKLVENACQAIAREILAEALPRLEAAGYPVILHVHDEIVCEVPIGHGSAQECERIMCKPLSWAEGLPLAAEGFEAERYKK